MGIIGHLRYSVKTYEHSMHSLLYASQSANHSAWNLVNRQETEHVCQRLSSVREGHAARKSPQSCNTKVIYLEESINLALASTHFALSIQPNRNNMSVFGRLWQQEILGKTCSLHGPGVKVAPRGPQRREPGAEEVSSKLPALSARHPSGQGPTASVFLFLLL